MSTPRRTLIHAGHVIAFDGRGHRLLRDGARRARGRSDRPRRAPRGRGSRTGSTRPSTPGTGAHAGAHLDPRPHRGLPARPVVHRGHRTAPVLLLGPLRDAAGARRRPGRGGEPGVRRLLDGRAPPGRRDDRARDRPAGRARRRARGRTSASGSTSGSRSARGAGSRGTAGAFTGSGTRSGAARASRRALALHDRVDGAHGGLVRCCLAPAQVDTCTPELLRAAKQAADERALPDHAPRVPVGGRVQRDAAAPREDAVAWLAELGFLGPSTILGHAIIVGGSSWANHPAGDVRIMGDAGCSVAHAVWVFARRGVPMESFARYREAGVNMSLGTDTNPQSVIEAMRWAAVLSKTMERNTQATTAGSRLRRRDPRRRAGPRPRRPGAHRARARRPTSSSGRAGRGA